MDNVVVGSLLFLAYTCLVYYFGYSTGFSSAIDQMKKVRNRK